MAIKTAEEDEPEEEDESVKQPEAAAAPKKNIKRNTKNKIKFLGEPMKEEGKRSYYSRVKINDMEVGFECLTYQFSGEQ